MAGRGIFLSVYDVMKVEKSALATYFSCQKDQIRIKVKEYLMRENMY